MPCERNKCHLFLGGVRGEQGSGQSISVNATRRVGRVVAKLFFQRPILVQQSPYTTKQTLTCNAYAGCKIGLSTSSPRTTAKQNLSIRDQKLTRLLIFIRQRGPRAGHTRPTCKDDNSSYLFLVISLRCGCGRQKQIPVMASYQAGRNCQEYTSTCAARSSAEGRS
jgi:hypothetical protein